MIKDKYYTPTIEEFYVGFECEINLMGAWVKNIVEIEDYQPLQGEINDYNPVSNTKFRVKYLDQEDIESLGFKETETMNFFELDNKQESYLSWYPEANRVEIGDNECSGGFSGTIKNKSELVKLLKQLGINE